MSSSITVPEGGWGCTAPCRLPQTAHRIGRPGLGDALNNAWLSPLGHRKPNLLGRYSFTAFTPAAGSLRPPRDPQAPELDEDETEAERTETTGKS
ncbi:hypothetical protein [Streptomyces phaeoluteigriseus]